MEPYEIGKGRGLFVDLEDSRHQLLVEIRYELNTSVFQDVIQHLIEWTRPTVQPSGRSRKPHRPRHQEA